MAATPPTITMNLAVDICPGIVAGRHSNGTYLSEAMALSGRKVSVNRQARRALRKAVSRANAKQTDAEAKATLLRGIATAEAWLDGTHEKLASS